ncbi:MAG: DUF4838 domain-containing protein [Bacteroidales bacterium]|nr:DUF4838 domain-containing protein [Bacteroidales bacterium]
MKRPVRFLSGCSILTVIFGFFFINAVSQSLYEPASGPFTIITVSGKAKAQIIVPAEPTYLEEFAASELQKYFKKISEVQLPILREGKNGKYSFAFFLGNTKKATKAGIQTNEERMGRDGFELKSIQKGLIIQGRNDLGTLFGVYELLERYFDVRWFMPGEEYYPETRTLKIGQVNLLYKPSFRVRWVGTGEWALKQRMNAYVKAGDRNVGINWKWTYHTFYTLMPPEKYYPDHPEYFAMVNGKRTVIPENKADGNQLCTSNPAVIRQIARSLIDTLDAEPGIEIVTLSPNDGGGFCECEKCRALDEPGRDWFAKYSNRLAVFNKEVSGIVKEKHPEVQIKVGAYAMYARPPLNKDFKPEDNQIIQLCHLYFCHNHPLGSGLCKAGATYDPNSEFVNNQEFEKILDQWLKISPHVFIYEYATIDGMKRANLPWPMIHAMRTDIPFYRNKGVEGFYTQQSDELFYRLGLNFYVAAKLCWNADLNVDALLNDYFEKFYGSAATPAKDFFMTIEKSMQEWNKCVSYGLQGVEGLRKISLEIFTPQVIEKMGKCLSSAEILSANNQIHSGHVAMIRKVYGEIQESLKTIKSQVR